ncbi:peptidase S8/S53 domain-containing protein [Ilyonectria sp. MPI-CAGE-AT-0026]|nr:peptidase S8/S53 domain-containing protein [Ilyonectria sp. MPI-CAGE-AT-0026]
MFPDRVCARDFTGFHLAAQEYAHPNDLDTGQAHIRQMEAVLYVDTYRTAFKITPSLMKANPNERHEVDVVFHLGVDSNNSSLQVLVSEKSNCPPEAIQFLSNKARLTIQVRHLDNVASVDDVRRIEEVGEVVLDNSTARRILRLDPQPATGSSLKPATDPALQPAISSAPQPASPQLATGSLPQHIYLGKRQVIAVADTGLDQGEHKPLHPAFTGRVIRWFGNTTADHIGHGTHVYGSAVGDLSNAGIWEPEVLAPGVTKVEGKLKPPADLTTLFEPPYKAGARVHSNSLGKRSKISANGVCIQLGYTDPARKIDTFVWDNPEMVICCAAGNQGKDPVGGPRKGHIGAQAAAKNCITVGASEKSPDSNIIADFSSLGPVIGDRPKPDVVAPGSDIISAKSSLANGLNNTRNSCSKSGTRMATPLVAGCAAVLRESLVNRSPPPTAALMKALLINGADILGPVNPNSVPQNVNKAGFGRVNMANALAVVHGEAGTSFDEPSVDDKSLLWEKKITLRLEVKDAHGSKFTSTNNVVQQVVNETVATGEVKLTVRVIGKALAESPQKFAISWRVY